MRKTFVVKQRSAFGTKSFFGTDCKRRALPLSKREAARSRLRDDGQMFQAVCQLGLEGIVSKELAWSSISARQKREQPNLASWLHASIMRLPLSCIRNHCANEFRKLERD